MVGTTLRVLAHPTAPSKRLLRTQPLGETLGIDEAAGVAAVADLALAFKSLDLEADHAALYCCDFSRDTHRSPNQRRAEMAISTSVPTVIQPG
ncbi:hypothetical protein V1288_003527 [Bradyrhizobium sp. AZCC 2176]